MKAKPTVYKGIRFRSKLEARWAVFFDALGVTWEYEPAIESVKGEYVPDFLMGSKTLIEVKPLIKDKSEPWCLAEDDWADRLELYERAVVGGNGNLEMFIVFGEPGRWESGRLVNAGHAAARIGFTGSLEFTFGFQMAECLDCGSIRWFRNGAPDCCPVWTHGAWMDHALNAVRDHSYGSDAVAAPAISSVVSLDEDGSNLPARLRVQEIDATIRTLRLALEAEDEEGKDPAVLKALDEWVTRLGREKASLTRFPLR